MLRGCTEHISAGVEGSPRRRQAGRHLAELLGLFPELNNLQWGAPSTIHTRNLIQLSKVNGLCATYVTVNVAIVCNWSLPADYLPCCTNARMLECANGHSMRESLAESNCKLNATAGLFSGSSTYRKCCKVRQGKACSSARLEATSIVFGLFPTLRRLR